MTTAQCRRPRLTAAVASAFAIIVLVTSCSTKTNTSAPTKLPPITATPTPTPTPTPEAQVEAFVRDYYAAVNEALLSGHVDRLTQFSRPECQCRRLPDGIRDVFAKGRMDGAHFTLEQLDVKEVAGSTAAVEVHYTTSAYTEQDSQGQVVRAYQSGPGHNLMSLVEVGDRWQLVDAVRMG